MKATRVLMAVTLVLTVAWIGAGGDRADAQGKTIKIGVLYDHSGPFSAAGSLNCWRGAKMIIDYVNERGGVLGKYKIVQVDGDSQSKAEVAINEAERLLNVEKVDILAGVISRAAAGREDRAVRTRSTTGRSSGAPVRTTSWPARTQASARAAQWASGHRLPGQADPGWKAK